MMQLVTEICMARVRLRNICANGAARQNQLFRFGTYSSPRGGAIGLLFLLCGMLLLTGCGSSGAQGNHQNGADAPAQLGAVAGSEAVAQATTLAQRHEESAPAPAPIGTVSYYESSVTLPVYPFEQYQSDAVDPDTNWPYKAFDYERFELEAPKPQNRRFRTIVLENAFLELTILPELGGRLWQVVHKPTGNRMFYQNTVVKPTRWGPGNQRGWFGLGGLEWAIGVPGTVGGAVVGNSGAHGGDMNGNLLAATIWEPGRGTRIYSNEEMGYGYRDSILKQEQRNEVPRRVVLSAELALKPEAVEVLMARADGFTAHRKQTQPAGASMGSMFKNPEHFYAGYLIEASGLKGYRVGKVQISDKHANFFINEGEANAEEIRALIAEAWHAVREQFGVELELEVELVGDWQFEEEA